MIKNKTTSYIFFAIAIISPLLIFAVYAGFYKTASSAIHENIEQTSLLNRLVDRQIRIRAEMNDLTAATSTWTKPPDLPS